MHVDRSVRFLRWILLGCLTSGVALAADFPGIVCLWLRTPETEALLGATIDPQGRTYDTPMGSYCSMWAGKHSVTLISNMPDDAASKSSVREQLDEFERLNTRGFQKLETKDFGDVACWHAEDVLHRRDGGSENTNDGCVLFRGGRLHLVIRADPPTRLDLAAVRDVLLKAAERRGRR